MKINIRKTS